MERQVDCGFGRRERPSRTARAQDHVKEISLHAPSASLLFPFGLRPSMDGPLEQTLYGKQEARTHPCQDPVQQSLAQSQV